MVERMPACRAVRADAELIVAAGGDGTVAAVAREMPGRELALAVLPLGTANNIALSLGCDGPLDALIEHWTQARVIHADLGVARGPWGERRFVEGVGGGLVARSIAASTPSRSISRTRPRNGSSWRSAGT